MEALEGVGAQPGQRQAVTGHLVARLARIRVADSTASTTIGTSAATASASSSAAIRSFDSSGWQIVPLACRSSG